MKLKLTLIACITLIAFALCAQAQEHEAVERIAFGGPDAVSSQVASDAMARENALYSSRLLEPYFDLKQRMQEKIGLGFSMDYTAVYLGANQSPPESADDAGSGILRFYGVWDLIGRNTEHTGSLVYKVEHRDSYTTNPPQGFGLNLGYAGLYEAPFNDNKWRVTNLYWKQRLAEGRLGFTLGFLDATDYVDVFALASPWVGFNNFAFSTGSSTIDLPNDATLGASVAFWLNNQWYAIAGLTDANADPTDPFEGFNTFFDESEYFTSLELGWTTSRDRYYFDNVHLTYWHTDARTSAGTPDGWGMNFSATHFTESGVMPFLRAGWAEDSGSVLQKSVSTGLGYQPAGKRDLVALGLNWGEANKTSFGEGLSDQVAAEAFYRLQLTEELALTPSVNLVLDPALNPDESSIWVFGIRARLAL
jgi:porin